MGVTSSGPGAVDSFGADVNGSGGMLTYLADAVELCDTKLAAITAAHPYEVHTTVRNGPSVIIVAIACRPSQ